MTGLQITGDGLPTVGTDVLKYQPFGDPLRGEVVPRDTWAHPSELTDDAFIVQYDNRRSLHRLERHSPTVIAGTVLLGQEFSDE